MICVRDLLIINVCDWVIYIYWLLSQQYDCEYVRLCDSMLKWSRFNNYHNLFIETTNVFKVILFQKNVKLNAFKSMLLLECTFSLRKRIYVANVFSLFWFFAFFLVFLIVFGLTKAQTTFQQCNEYDESNDCNRWYEVGVIVNYVVDSICLETFDVRNNCRDKIITGNRNRNMISFCKQFCRN